jgi:hypothetical protein
MANALEFLINLRMQQNGVPDSVQRLQKNLDNAEKSAKKVTGAFGKLKDAIMTLPGAQFFTNPFVAITAGIGEIAKLGMEEEKVTMQFATLLQSQEKAESLIKSIRGFAANTSLHFEDLISASKTLLAFNIPSQNIMSYLKMLGDVSMGDADKLRTLTEAFGRVMSFGQMTSREQREMITGASYNPLIDIKQMTGLSLPKLREAMGKGRISADLIVKAFQHATVAGGKYHDFLKKLSKTATGKLSTVVDEFRYRLIDLYKVIAPILNPTLDILLKLVKIIAPPLQFIVSKINELFNAIKKGNPFIWASIAGITTFIVIIKSLDIAIWALSAASKAYIAIQKIINLLFISNPIGLLIAGISALIVGVILAWNKFAGFRAFLLTMWDVIKGLANIIKDYLIDRIVGLIKGLGALGQAFYKLFTGDFKGAWTAAKEGASAFFGIDSMKKGAKDTVALYKSIHSTWNKNLTEQQRLQKQKNKEEKVASPSSITTPGIAGLMKVTLPPSTKKKKKGRSASEDAVTGGVRSNVITVNVGKFFDNLRVYMADKTDTMELEKIITESMTRALAVATSSAE